jgi:hypothetical protein
VRVLKGPYTTCLVRRLAFSWLLTENEKCALGSEGNEAGCVEYCPYKDSSQHTQGFVFG